MAGDFGVSVVSISQETTDEDSSKKTRREKSSGTSRNRVLAFFRTIGLIASDELLTHAEAKRSCGASGVGKLLT